MAIETENAGQLLPRVGQETLRRRWGWFVGLGVALAALGVFAVGYSAAMTAVTLMVIGWVLVASGVLEVVHAFWRKGWGGFFLDIATGVLYFAVGAMIVASPAISAVTLTFLVAMFLIVGGLFRGIMAVAVRYPNWGWMLAHAVISVALGVMIWQGWPASGLFFIGLYVGIELVLNGVSLITLGLAARKLPSTHERTHPESPPREPLHA